MRYIRTKDRIYDASLYVREYTGWYFHEETRLYAFFESEIIKTADTIEELCDMFVIEKKEPFIGKLEDLPRLIHVLKTHNRNSKNKWNLYGAIWTKIGLIYVVKMNEEGVIKIE